jgi:aryl-alcohol dehydrogenase-like predicted oxidoreductase
LPVDDWRKTDACFREPQLGRHLATVDRVRAVADRLGVSPGAVAIAWTLRNPAVDGAIVGLRRPDQVDELLAASALALGVEDTTELDATVAY